MCLRSMLLRRVRSWCGAMRLPPGSTATNLYASFEITQRALVNAPTPLKSPSIASSAGGHGAQCIMVYHVKPVITLRTMRKQNRRILRNRFHSPKSKPFINVLIDLFLYVSLDRSSSFKWDFVLK